MRASCVLSASRGLAYVPLDVSEVEMASSSLDSSSVFAIVGLPNGAEHPWLSVLLSLAPSACASLATSLNWSSRLVRRIKLVAAVAPVVEFSNTLISDVRSSPRRRIRRTLQVGQASRTWRTVIAPVSHGQRGLRTVGTFRAYKKALKPIFPVRSWTKRELISFFLPACSLRTALEASGVRWAVVLPFVHSFQPDSHYESNLAFTDAFIAER